MSKTAKQLFLEYQKDISILDDNTLVQENEFPKDLEKLLSKIKKKTLTVVCARPCNGLSAFKNTLLEQNKTKTLILSKNEVETSFYRYLSHITGLLFKKISEKELYNHQLIHVLNKTKTDLNNKIIFAYQNKFSSEYLLKELIKHPNTGVLIIEDLHQFIEKNIYLIKQLKKIAKQFKIKIIALYELEDVAVESSYLELKPSLEDLKKELVLQDKTVEENGIVKTIFPIQNVLNKIDNLLFLFRPEFYEIKTFYKSDTSTEHKIEIAVHNKSIYYESFIFGFSGGYNKIYDLYEEEGKRFSWLDKLREYKETLN